MIKPSDFVHLHVHTEFSLLDGKCRVGELLDVAQAAGQDAMAITDHGNLFGAISFYKEARKRGMKPLLGIEAYVAPGGRAERRRVELPGKRKSAYHITLIAQNAVGWSNIIKLSSLAYLEGFYYKPRIDHEIMRQYGEGIIALSGCLAGEVNQSILAEDMEGAEKIIRTHQEIFGKENYYLEVMDHGIDLELQVKGKLAELAKVTGASLIATNDIHYVAPDDWEAQDVALCIGTGKTIDDPDRFRMATRDLFFKTTEQMAEIFHDMPEAVTNTREIADRCNLEIALGNRFLPAFGTPAGVTSEDYFRQLCWKGVEDLYEDVNDAVKERLEYEMKVIVDMGFVDYFLITWDFIRYARENNIPVGPGRGSAAGSIVAYALQITQLDPLKYDLLFERFLNAERVSMPDIDIDFCKDRRGEVIEYVEKKYGREKVAQIITFGTMKARAVIRDVGRALDIPLAEIDRIAKKIPNGPKDTLRGALASDPELQGIYAESPANKNLFDVALKLEGAPRHASIHAAGVVIADAPLMDRVPLCKSGDGITTQWPNEILEEIGLLKMDFLGLRTLTIIREALDNVEKTTGQRLDPLKFPLDDKKTFALLSRGEASGVFQLESDGMKDLLRRMRPDRFEDVVAVLALYRPGPLGSGMVDSYVQRKHGLEDTAYSHPILEPVLKDTLGVILYQEQVMRIANVMSGFSLNDADNLRKAMGKKKPEILAKFKEQFVAGAVRKDIQAATASEVFDLIEYFAGYGFNKSHSAAYALVTYQTAWLKANYPVEYMAGLLSCEMISIEKTVEYTEECRSMNIELLPPDVNRSYPRFSVEDGKIRFALAALKGVGEAALDPLIAQRKEHGEYRDLFDLCERVDVQRLNKGAMEALIYAGAMDSLPGNRAQKIAVVDDALAIGSAAEKDRRSGQGSLFGMEMLIEEEVKKGASPLPNIPEFPEKDRLQKEKNVLGFYLTGHPLNRYRNHIYRFAETRLSGLGDREEGAEVVVGGIITKVRVIVIRNGKNAGRKMAALRLEDFTGSAEGVIFSDLYEQIADSLVQDRIAFFRGEVDRRREEASLRITKIIDVDDAQNHLTKRITLAVDTGDDMDMILSAVRRVLLSHRGQIPVYFNLRTQDHRNVLIQAGEKYRVDVTSAVLPELEKVLGKDRILLN